MSTSRLDAMYRSILITKFFTKGWGKPENLKRLFEFRKVVSNRDECFKLVDRDYPVTITKEQTLADCRLFEGYFITPLEKYLPGIVPEIAQKAHFQAMLPLHWQDPKCKPVCLHLAGTGDHFFWRRRNLMVKPLLKEAGIGGIILENPFYGLRKPIDQIRSSLHNVSDIFVMGGCLILESLVMFHWCERNGLGPLGVTGLSMGGHGVMAHSINWDLLEDQYLSDGVYREKLSKMVTIIDEAFLAGKKFARSYSQNIKRENVIAHLDIPTKADKLDITYKENSKIEADNVKSIDSNETVRNTTVDTNSENSDLDSNKNGYVKNSHDVGTTKNVTQKKSSKELVHKKVFTDTLLKLLNENKISKELFDKLNSNETFMLQPDDIEVINKINEKRIKELLIKCKIGEVNEFLIDPSQIAETPNEKENIEKKHIKNSEYSKFMKPNSEIIEKDETSNEPKNKPEKKSWNVSDLTSDIWTNLPFVRSSGKKIDISKIHWRDREALQFMRGIMDECTHLSNFSVPFDTSLIIAVCASHDAYVPRDDVGTLEEIWPGAEVRYVDAGHVSAYILHQSVFRSCIKEAFERSKKKWDNGRHIC